jgi:hypothetical protein
LNKGGKHNSDAKEITDVGEIYVKIPTEIRDVVKYSEPGNAANKSECQINRLIYQLNSSVFYHHKLPLKKHLYRYYNNARVTKVLQI